MQAILALAVVLVLLPLALRAAYHCDELNLMRHVALFARGDLDVPGRPGLLWFPLIPLLWLGDPAAILLGGRLVVVAVAALSAALLLRLCARGGGAAGAAAALALLVLSPNWLAHAFEIRTDAFVLPLEIGLLLLLLRPRPSPRSWWLGGLMLGAALLFSQKTAYFAVALQGAVLVHAAASRRRGALRGAVWTLAALDALALALVVGYYALMAWASGGGMGFVDENLSAAAATAFGESSLDRKLGKLWGQVTDAPVLYLAAVLGLGAAAWRPTRRPVVTAVAALALALQATVLVHRGYFHYYVAYLEPMVVPLAAVTTAALWPARRSARVAVLAVALAAAAWVSGPRYRTMLRVHNGPQLAVIRTVTEAFDGPVVVFDGIGFFPGWPQPGPFLTKGGRDAYRARYPDDGLIRLWREPPALVYVYDYMTRRKYLTRAERAYVDEHYVPYRPNVRLLGYRGVVPPRRGAAAEILVGGDYTAWFAGGWSGTVRVGTTEVTHGATVDLEPGVHPLVVDDLVGGGELWLLVGAGRRPEEAPRDLSMFPLLSRERYQRYRRDGDLHTPPHDPSLDR